MESNSAIIEGVIHFIGEEAKVSETSNTTKQLVVVKTDGQYTQHVPVSFINGKCGNELSNLREGDQIKITVNINGREYDNPQKGKQYFIDLSGWKVEGKSAGSF